MSDVLVRLAQGVGLALALVVVASLWLTVLAAVLAGFVTPWLAHQ